VKKTGMALYIKYNMFKCQGFSSPDGEVADLHDSSVSGPNA